MAGYRGQGQGLGVHLAAWLGWWAWMALAAEVPTSRVYEAEEWTTPATAWRVDADSEDRWNLWSTDSDALRKWSKSIVFRSPTVR